MKKTLTLFAVLLLVTLTLSAATGLVYAQTDPPPNTPSAQDGIAQFMRGGRFGNSFGMMNRFYGQGRTEGYGPMHTYMIEAIAKELGLSAEEIQEQLKSGKTMWQIAEEKGFSVEQFSKLMLSVRTRVLEQAVENGLISRERADWMIARMNQMHTNGFGPGLGGCTGFGMRNQRGGAGLRWAPTPTP